MRTVALVHDIALTRRRCARQHDCLKPHREEVGNGEVACRDQKVAHSDKNGNFLPEEGGGKDGLGGNIDLEYDKQDEKDTG